MIILNYIEFREKQNIKSTTIKSELLVINQFENFLNNKYKSKIEYTHISSKDVHEYLDQQKKINKLITVNKKIIYLKIWFNYLWITKQITYDYVCKIPLYKITEEKTTTIQLTYKELQNSLIHVARANIPIVTKLIYIFYLKGIQPRDIFNIKISNITEIDNKIIISDLASNNKIIHLIFDDPIEVNLINESIERAIFGNTDYIFNSKKRGDNDLSQIIQENISEHIVTLNEILGFKLTYKLCKTLYIEYLFVEKKMRIENIAATLATSILSVTHYLNNLIDLNKTNRYNII